VNISKHYIKKQAPRNKTRGVTLVELMIAITIGAIISIGIGSVYTSSKRSFKLQEEFSRLQENGRFAMNYIARFVRGAGYSGCSSGVSNMINDINSTDVELLFQTGLEGYEAGGTAPNETVAALTEYPSVSATAADFTTNTSSGEVAINAATLTNLGVLPKSDILIARVADSSGVEITTNNGSAEFTINWTGTEANACTQNSPSTDRISDICDNDFLIVSDCEKSIAFQVSGITKLGGSPPLAKITHSKSGTPGNKSASWGAAGAKADPGFDFVEGDEIVRVTTKFFYVGKGVSGPALFMKDGTGTPTELVEGVENIQVLYGEDTDGTPDNIPDRYVPANQVTDFGNVTAVRLTILLRSVKNLPWRTDAEKTYLLGGTTAATATTVTSPSDKRLRRTMSMTIKLRNRAFSL